MFVCFVLYSVFAPVINIFASINSIPMLSGINFKEWRENILIVLRVMDLDLALRIDHHTEVTKEVPLIVGGKWKSGNDQTE